MNLSHVENTILQLLTVPILRSRKRRNLKKHILGKRRLAYVQVITITDVAKCDGKDKRQKIQKNTQLCDL